MCICSTSVFDITLLKHTNHMTMTTSGQIMSWTYYLKTKGNVNIKLRDLCETLIVYILLSTFQLVHMVLTVNKPDMWRFIAWIESADWNPCYKVASFLKRMMYNEMATGVLFMTNHRSANIVLVAMGIHKCCSKTKKNLVY